MTETLNVLLGMERPVEEDMKKEVAEKISDEMAATGLSYSDIYMKLHDMEKLLAAKAEVIEMATWCLKDRAFHELAGRVPANPKPHVS